MSSPIYYSQYGQDKYIDALFKEKENGVFVEIGAHNGEAFSNTCMLERYRHWSGLCVEPLSHCFEELKTKRSCHKLNVCISDYDGEADFLFVGNYSEMLSGLLNSYPQEHIDRIDREIRDCGSTKRVIKVQTVTLKTAFDQFGIGHVDYCSIDTEGSEIQILHSIDFNTIDIDVFSVENNYGGSELEEFFRSKNYHKLIKLGCDELYRKYK